MGKQQHIDNDIVAKAKKNNVNDNVGDSSNLRDKVLEKITEYKLNSIQDFMFGGPNLHYGDAGAFVNTAIKQVERFFYIWMTELDEETRKTIINYMLGVGSDTRNRPYSYYTNSPAWKYCSTIIKIENGYTCNKCGKSYNPAHLVVHHKTYEHIGSEILHPEDMEVLCTYCHMDEHGVRRAK